MRLLNSDIDINIIIKFNKQLDTFISACPGSIYKLMKLQGIDDFNSSILHSMPYNFELCVIYRINVRSNIIENYIQ
jgi:hypothetical protein